MRTKNSFSKLIVYLALLPFLSSCQNTVKLEMLDIGIHYTEKYAYDLYHTETQHIFYQFRTYSDFVEKINDKDNFVLDDPNNLAKYDDSFFESNSISLLTIKSFSSDIYEYAAYDNTTYCIYYHFKEPDIYTDDILIRCIFNIVPTNERLNFAVQRE